MRQVLHNNRSLSNNQQQSPSGPQQLVPVSSVASENVENGSELNGTLSAQLQRHQGLCVVIVAVQSLLVMPNSGFRTREIIVHTSLLDDVEYSQEDIAALFRRRWQAELHLRSLKTVMQMEHLRCKKPHRVRNEVRAHMIAYNLIRQVMSEAASRTGVRPWQISFKATMTTLVEALPVLGMIRDPADLCRVVLACCQQHRVGDRADRYEPRVVKRRPTPYKLMQKPRRDYKPGEA
ncbi:MAG: transposase [Planctomycetia bacterium]|nr:transposase [Planctomycetia bacterium]